MDCYRCGKPATTLMCGGDRHYCDECAAWVRSSCKESDEKLERALYNTPVRRFLRFLGWFK